MALLQTIRSEGYHFSDFSDGAHVENAVVLRHDVDFSLKIAAEFSELEAELQIPATYFVLINTDFYNVCSRENRSHLQRIVNNGGTIGLHFDVSQYRESLPPPEDTHYSAQLNQYAQQERMILEAVVGRIVPAIAFHCPSQSDIQSDARFDGMINAYGRKFFREFKYLSDSSMHWREDVDRVLREHQYRRLQILTHPFWYPKRESSKRELLKQLCLDATQERYHSLEQNFDSLHEFLLPSDLEALE